MFALRFSAHAGHVTVRRLLDFIFRHYVTSALTMTALETPSTCASRRPPLPDPHVTVLRTSHSTKCLQSRAWPGFRSRRRPRRFRLPLPRRAHRASARHNPRRLQPALSRAHRGLPLPVDACRPPMTVPITDRLPDRHCPEFHSRIRTAAPPRAPACPPHRQRTPTNPSIAPASPAARRR